MFDKFTDRARKALAEVVIADASGRDPGVACALGLALAFGRCPLLLTHDDGDLPAGLRTLRALRYDPVDLLDLRERLTTGLEAFLAAIRAEGPTS